MIEFKVDIDVIGIDDDDDDCLLIDLVQYENIQMLERSPIE